jgi:hypothetical protein
MGTEEKPVVVKKPNRVLQVTGEVIHEMAGKMPSRKLTVWTAATVAFFMGKIDAEWWAYISLAYISVQSTLDFLKVKSGK